MTSATLQALWDGKKRYTWENVERNTDEFSRMTWLTLFLRKNEWLFHHLTYIELDSGIHLLTSSWDGFNASPSPCQLALIHTVTLSIHTAMCVKNCLIACWKVLLNKQHLTCRRVSYWLLAQWWHSKGYDFTNSKLLSIYWQSHS